MKIFLYVFTILTFFGSTQAMGKPLIAVDKRTDAPDFVLQDLNGETKKLSDYKGKVVVISLWATWCKPCLLELSFLKKLWSKDKSKFEILAVATDGPNTSARIRPVVRQKKLNMPVLLDTEGRVMAGLNGQGILPFSAYVDRKGRIAYTHGGFVAGDQEDLARVIEQLVQEK